MVAINGVNFANTPTVRLSWTQPPLPPAGGYVLPADRVTFVNEGKLEIAIVTGTTADTWTVQVTNPDGRSSQPYPFAVQGTSPCEKRPSAFGLTIITHGYQLPPWIPTAPFFPAWVTEMAFAVSRRMGEGDANRVPIDRLRLTGSAPWFLPRVVSQECQNCGGGAPRFGADGVAAGIVMVDWSEIAGGISPVSTDTTEQVADAVFDHLFADTAVSTQLISVPLHLIGHSRGGSLVSRLAHRFAQRGIWVDHVTTLDPHPLTRDFEVSSWENILFADNLYRTGGTAIIPDGEPILGTYERNLTSVTTGRGEACEVQGGRNGSSHEQVHTYYHGTIDTTATCADKVEIQTDWYNSDYPRERTGYHFSRTGGGDRYSGKALEGLHYRLARSGTANRELVQVTQPAWPNATFMPLASYNLTAGSSVKLIYFYQDADSPMDVEFFLDDDANPFNNDGNSCYRKIGEDWDLPSRHVISAPQTFDWTPRESDLGTWYLQIKASDVPRVRYDYLPHPITITASGQPPSDLVIENLRVSPGQAIPGEAVTVSFSIRNVGGGVAYPSVANVRLNASSAAVLVSDEPLALGLETPRLLPGAAHGFNRTATLPPVSASGTYYVWVIADVGNRANQGDTSDASDKTKAAIAVTVPPLGGVGDWVEVYGTGTAGLRVRGPEPCDAPLDGAKRLDGRKGLVLEGPRTCTIGGQDYTLWKVRWEDCVEGWSAQDWLRKIATETTFNCRRELRVVRTLESGGNVSAHPAKAVYEYGDLVALTAYPAPGYYLDGWEEVDSADGLNAQVTMNFDRTVTVHFERLEPASPDCGCAVECAAGSGGGARLAGPGEAIDLNLLRRFRDEVLAATPEGRTLIDEFYQNSAEILHHMAANPAVLGAVQEAIVDLQPTVRDLVEGEGQQPVSEAQVQAVTALAQQLHQAGGVVLRATIESELERIGPLDALAGKTSAEARRQVVGTLIRLLEPRLLEGVGFEFRVIGDVAGTLRVECSDDLRTWVPLDGEMIQQLPATVRDLNPPLNGHRYYRVVTAP